MDGNLVLDVGCGNNPTGDVNCDLFLAKTGHRPDTSALDLEKIKNFVCCDVMQLPFKDNCFNVVYSNQVIEHTKDPFRFMVECLRVSFNRVIVRCPHLLGDNPKNKFHVQKFTRRWFLSRYNVVSSQYYKWRVPWIFSYFPIFRVPEEMEIVIRK